jgi:hypothetical protein
MNSIWAGLNLDEIETERGQAEAPVPHLKEACA